MLAVCLSKLFKYLVHFLLYFGSISRVCLQVLSLSHRSFHLSWDSSFICLFMLLYVLGTTSVKSFVAPSFASSSALSFRAFPLWDLTHVIVTSPNSVSDLRLVLQFLTVFELHTGRVAEIMAA